MNQWSSIDQQGTQCIHDAFCLTQAKSGHCILKIAVTSNFHFKQRGKIRECTVLTLVINNLYEIIHTQFDVQKIKLQTCYTFHEFDNRLDVLLYHKKHEIIQYIIDLGGKISSKNFVFSSINFVASLMAIFTKKAKDIYKLCCKKYGRCHSPKHKEYRLELARRIKNKNKKRFQSKENRLELARKMENKNKIQKKVHQVTIVA